MADLSLLPYVPRLTLRLLGQSAAAPSHIRLETFDAAVLLADVSGFTGLIDQLVRDHGNRGAERLQEMLNRCFGPLTDLVEAAGGEVLGFPGDAALAIWRSDDHSHGLDDLVHRTAACSLELLARLDRFRAMEGVELRLRVAIGAGSSCAALVGGLDGRWETVLLGDAVTQLHGSLETARPGEVVLSSAASVAARSVVRGERRGDHLVVSDVTRRGPVAAIVRDPGDAVPEAVVKALIPRSLMARIEAGQNAWLAEFRQLTVTFIRVRSVASDDYEAVQRTGQLVQQIVARFDGELHRIASDDKGLAVIVLFGVAQRAHEDDAARAVRTALAIRQETRESGVDVRAGVTTGRVFMGRLGSESRFEFVILGASVVLAARLSGVAEDVLCDAATRSACRRSVRFESRPPSPIKGKNERVEVWKPLSFRLDAERAGVVTIGREAERGLLERALSALERRAHTGVVILEGEPGIGKTVLINDLMKWAQSHAIRSLIGASDAVDRQRAYLTWRSVIGRLLTSLGAHDEYSLREQLLEFLGADAAHWLPLLNPVLPVSLAEDAHILNLDGDSRARTTRELIVTLLESAARVSPLFIVLEDAHWMDSASWELAEQVMARVPRLLLLISTRRQTERNLVLDRLRARPDATTLVLRALVPGEIRDLVCRRLDVDEIPTQMAELIDRRAEGHPLFAAELTMALRDRGALVVRDGVCTLAPDAEQLFASALPDTVHATVAARIDQLTAQQQFTLKVAAVLGRQFSLSGLADVHPLADVHTLDDQLARIVDSGLIERQALPEDSFMFSHAVVQDVAYDLLPFHQRGELHKRTAEWLERSSSSPGENLAPLLAHHWERAEVVEKAVHYLEIASERALLRDSSDREAEDFLTRLLALAASRPETGQEHVVDVPMIGSVTERSINLAKWERFLSQALARQGRYLEGRRHLERCIGLLGQRTPTATPLVCAEFVGRLTRRLTRRPPPPRGRCRTAAARRALLELSLAYERLNEYQYMGQAMAKDGGLIARGTTTLRAVRAAELAGPSAELSRAYSFIANLVAMCRRPHLAEYYAAQGQAIAVEVGSRHALFRALRIGQLSSFNHARWEKAIDAFNQAIALGSELGIVVERLMCEHSLAYAQLNAGRLDEALAGFHNLRVQALRHDALIPLLWATVAIGEVAFQRRRLPEAISWAENALELAERRRSPDQICRFQAHGLLASARLRVEGVEKARPHLIEAVEAAAGGAHLSLTPRSGFLGVAEVLFAVWDRGGAEAHDAQSRLRPWLRTLRQMAFHRPFLEPLDLMCRAWWSARLGRTSKAVGQLRKAIRSADRMSLDYEAGVARIELARVLPTGDLEQQRALEDAEKLLSRIGATEILRESQTRTPRGGGPANSRV